MYFFTLVTYDRREILTTDFGRTALRDAIERTRAKRPWVTEAVVLLPDHLHAVWRLPEGDVDYSTRIGALKKRFTRTWLASGGAEADVLNGQSRHRLRGVWQPRFW